MRKARKQRDPSREPFASRLSDDERQAISRRVQAGTHEDSDLEAFVHDIRRAHQKIGAAIDQIKSPNDEHLAIFSQSDLSAASAQASVETSLSAKLDLVWAGGTAKRAQKRAGLARHSEFNDPETAKRYKARRSAWQEIDRESAARGAPRLKGRPLAEAIARTTGHSFNTVRTWIRQENKRRRSVARQMPRIVPGDYSQLVD
jgi:hypothetical protein